MHEVTIAKNILNIIKTRIKDDSVIKKVMLEIGVLAAVDINALKFGFQVIARNTVCDNSEIVVDLIEAIAICESCENTSSGYQYGDSCKTCGSFSLKILQGEELRVKSMEVV